MYNKEYWANLELINFKENPLFKEAIKFLEENDYKKKFSLRITKLEEDKISLLKWELKKILRRKYIKKNRSTFKDGSEETIDFYSSHLTRNVVFFYLLSKLKIKGNIEESVIKKIFTKILLGMSNTSCKGRSLDEYYLSLKWFYNNKTKNYYSKELIEEIKKHEREIKYYTSKEQEEHLDHKFEIKIDSLLFKKIDLLYLANLELINFKKNPLFKEAIKFLEENNCKKNKISSLREKLKKMLRRKYIKKNRDTLGNGDEETIDIYSSRLTLNIIIFYLLNELEVKKNIEKYILKEILPKISREILDEYQNMSLSSHYLALKWFYNGKTKKYYTKELMEDIEEYELDIEYYKNIIRKKERELMRFNTHPYLWMIRKEERKNYKENLELIDFKKNPLFKEAIKFLKENNYKEKYYLETEDFFLDVCSMLRKKYIKKNKKVPTNKYKINLTFSHFHILTLDIMIFFLLNELKIKKDVNKFILKKIYPKIFPPKRLKKYPHEYYLALKWFYNNKTKKYYSKETIEKIKEYEDDMKYHINKKQEKDSGIEKMLIKKINRIYWANLELIHFKKNLLFKEAIKFLENNNCKEKFSLKNKNKINPLKEKLKKMLRRKYIKKNRDTLIDEEMINFYSLHLAMNVIIFYILNELNVKENIEEFILKEFPEISWGMKDKYGNWNISFSNYYLSLKWFYNDKTKKYYSKELIEEIEEHEDDIKYYTNKKQKDKLIQEILSEESRRRIKTCLRFA